MKIINIVWLGEEPGLHQGKTMDHDLVEQIVTGMTPSTLTPDTTNINRLDMKVINLTDSLHHVRYPY